MAMKSMNGVMLCHNKGRFILYIKRGFEHRMDAQSLTLGVFDY